MSARRHKCHGGMMRTFSYLVLLSIALAAPAQAQVVSIPQVDRGPGVFVPQFQTPAAPGIRQLPETARVVPRPTVTRIVQQPVPETFVTETDAVALPDAWNTISDETPIVATTPSVAAVPSVGGGVTVILTAQSADSLPSVGAGAVASQ